MSRSPRATCSSGPADLRVVAVALLSGANDFGGTLMEESISRESGSQHGENLAPEEFRRLIREMRRTPAERSTKYEILPVLGSNG